MIDYYFDETTPQGRLITYLSKRTPLSNEFVLGIKPMLEDERLKTDLECPKEKGISQTAYWIDEGFGYSYEVVEDKIGRKSDRIVGIYPAGTIMLDEHGFFNGAVSHLNYAVKKNSLIIPFSTVDFGELAKKAPETAILATRVVAENKKFEQDRSRLLRMHKSGRRDAMIAFFGRVIEEVFTFKELGGYLCMTDQYYSREKNKTLRRRG